MEVKTPVEKVGLKRCSSAFWCEKNGKKGMRHNWMKLMLASPAILAIEALIPTGIAAMPLSEIAQSNPVPEVEAIAQEAANSEPLDLLEQINLYSDTNLGQGPLSPERATSESLDILEQINLYS
ncbi:MAG: hypothetical protein ACRC8Y_00260, partial [Chroococcales cyanobacterium]